jgi:predicted nucleic acid-binding protein
MILADTSVWADHFRAGNAELMGHLERRELCMHPFVAAELALGHLPGRSAVLRELRSLPASSVATTEEVVVFIEGEALYGLGIGYVEAALLASVRLEPGARLWTRDRRLTAVAARMGIAWPAMN